MPDKLLILAVVIQALFCFSVCNNMTWRRIEVWVGLREGNRGAGGAFLRRDQSDIAGIFPCDEYAAS